MLLARAIRFSFLFSSSFFHKWLIFLQAGIQLTNDSLSLSGSATGWRWRQRLLMLRGGGNGVIGHSRMWKARERLVHREHGPHTKGHGGPRWGRVGQPRRRGHAGNQSWQHRHFSCTEGSAVSGPLGDTLTCLYGAASSTLLSHSSSR